MTLSYVEDLSSSEVLKAELGDLDSITNYCQAIVDIAYNNLKSLEDLDRPGTYNAPGWRENRPWSYTMLLSVTKSTYGNLAEFAVMISTYHQQVCNGGHLQYWDNGYASSGRNGEDIYLHHQLRSYYDYFLDEVKNFLNLSEEDYKLLLEVDTIMNRFQQQLELESGQSYRIVSNEQGELYKYDEDISNYPEPTRWCQEHWDYLDNHYYKISEKFIEILKDYFREKVELS